MWCRSNLRHASDRRCARAAAARNRMRATVARRSGKLRERGRCEGERESPDLAGAIATSQTIRLAVNCLAAAPYGGLEKAASAGRTRAGAAESLRSQSAA